MQLQSAAEIVESLAEHLLLGSTLAEELRQAAIRQGCQRTIVPKEKRTQLSKRGFFTSKKDIFSISFNDIFQ